MNSVTGAAVRKATLLLAKEGDHESLSIKVIPYAE